MNAECERWMDLADQSATGAILSDKDKAWLAQHTRACPACGAEDRVYGSLHEALGRPEALLVPTPGRGLSRPRVLARRSVIFGLALAAGLALVLGGRALLRRAPAAPSAQILTTQIRFSSGETRLGSAPAQAGQTIPQGDRLDTGAGLACVGMAGSIEVCLDAASAASFSSSDPNQILVYLEKGTLMARLDHQPPGRRFVVRTAGTEVQAVGTRFSVRLEDNGDTLVSLHEGRVVVRAASHITSELFAPVQARIAQDIRMAPLRAADIEQDKRLGDLVGLARTEGGASLWLTSTPVGAEVLLDDLPLGQTPISMSLARAAHVRLSSPGHESVSEWIEVKGQARVERTFGLIPVAAPPPVTSARPEVAQTPTPFRRGVSLTPDRLLAKAQSLRSQGLYEDCARTYRRLWMAFPGSEAAKVSMISLGELELVQRDHPRSALRAFEAYLRQGGPLEREARFGKIRALRALDRREQAEAETARFLDDYPTSSQASTLRRSSHDE